MLLERHLLESQACWRFLHEDRKCIPFLVSHPSYCDALIQEAHHLLSYNE